MGEVVSFDRDVLAPCRCGRLPVFSREELEGGQCYYVCSGSTLEDAEKGNHHFMVSAPSEELAFAMWNALASEKADDQPPSGLYYAGQPVERLSRDKLLEALRASHREKELLRASTDGARKLLKLCEAKNS